MKESARFIQSLLKYLVKIIGSLNYQLFVNHYLITTKQILVPVSQQAREMKLFHF
jgi:hypothetical protein